MLVFGSIGYDLGRSKGKETMAMAAVGTDSEISGLPLPSRESNEEVILAIFERTAVAAEAGAKVVVWNEAAFYLEKDNEKQWLDSIGMLSKKNNVTIVAAMWSPYQNLHFNMKTNFSSLIRTVP